MVVAPRSRCSLAISTRVWPRSAASRLDSGSSDRNTLGARTMARPVATRRRGPPEGSRGRRGGGGPRVRVAGGEEVEDGGGELDLGADDGRIGLGQLQRKAHVLVHAHVRVQRIALEH